MSNLSLVPLPSEPATSACSNCGAPLVADQRYCLSCGQPCSPVRLAFLDVLQSDAGRQGAPGQAFGTPGAIDVHPAAYVPLAADGAGGWLRRYSGLLSLLSVLALCLLVGLLVGHWVTQSNKAPANTTVKIEGLTGLAGTGAPASKSPSTEASAAEPATSKSTSKQETKEAEEGEHETKAEKAPPPPAKKVTQTKLKKLSSTTGKKHQEELNELGSQPIETG